MTEEIKKTSTVKKVLITIVGIFVGLIVLGMIVGDDKAGSSATSKPADPAVPPLEVTAGEISKAYQANEARAQLAYEGKVLKVSGVVKDIDLSLGDAPVIRLKGAGDQYNMGVNANGKMTDVNISGISKDEAAAIDKGGAMIFQCATISEVMGSANLGDCKIVGK